MPTVGVFVGERDDRRFFHEVLADLERRFTTELYRDPTASPPVFKERWLRWAQRQRMTALLRRSDLCFFEWASEWLAVATRLPKTCPIVTRLHSFELHAWAPRVCWDRVDRVIFVSEFIRDQFVARYPDHADRTVVVHNGVVLDRFTPRRREDAPHRLGVLAQLHPRKRIYETVLTLHALRQAGLDLTLHVAGGPVTGGYFDGYRTAIDRLVSALDLTDHVVMEGHVDDPVPWLQQMDIVISNSYWEGQQVALIEAMACGCYCLAHRWGGAEEVLPDANLYLTEAELIEQIRRHVASSAGAREAQRQQMREIATGRFDVRDTVSLIGGIVEDTVAARPPTAAVASPAKGPQSPVAPPARPPVPASTE